MPAWTLQYENEIQNGLNFKIKAQHLVDNFAGLKSDIDDRLSRITASAQTVAGAVTWNGNQTFAAGVEVIDGSLIIRDNADATKRARFEVSGVTAGQTRVLTIPNYDATLATLAGTETLTNKTISGANNTLSAIPLTALVTSGSPSNANFLRGDGAWAVPVAGDVVGPGSNSENRIALWDAASKTLKDGPALGSLNDILASNGAGLAPAFKSAATLGLLTASQVATLTNKTISGASNTLSNIPLTALTTTGSPSANTFLAGNGAWSAVPIAGLNATGTPSASNFLRGDGTWSVPPGGGDVAGPVTTSENRIALWDASNKTLKDGPALGSNNDILASNGASAAPSFKSLATLGIQPLNGNLTAIAGLTSTSDRLPYFTGLHTAALTTFTSFARSLLDDTNAAGMQATLGLVPGTNVQAYSANLQALTSLSPTADRLPYYTGSSTAALATLTSFARTLLDDTNAAGMQSTLGLVIGTNVQAYNANLQALAGLTSQADRLPYFTGANTATTTVFTAFARTLLDDADAAAVRTTLGGLPTLTGTETLTNKTIGNTNFLTVRDDRFTLQDNTDNTKQAIFELSGITTGTTRALTIPNASTTLVGTDTTQTLTNKSIDAGQLTGTIADARLSSNIVTLAGAQTLTNKTIAGNSNTITGIGAVPIGAVIEWAGTSLPAVDGNVTYEWADGRAISRTTFAACFAALSTTYGVGDGSTTFNLPDRRGRTGIGRDNLGGTAANRVTSASTGGANATTLGGSGGAETHTLTTTELAAHAHGLNRLNTQSGSGAERTNGGGSDANGTTTGGGGAHNNTQPWIAMNYIVRVA